MFSIRTVLFLSCAAMTMAVPFFRMAGPEREQQFEVEQPLRAAPGPLNQVASPSYDYGAGGDDGTGGGTGGGTETASQSNEVDADAGGSLAATDNDAEENENERGEMEAAEQAGANAAENDSPDAVQTAGGASGAASPNSLDGGSKLAKKGEKSSAGQNAGIAVGVIAMVGLAAGIGYFIYRKRRAAAYGSRF